MEISDLVKQWCKVNKTSVGELAEITGRQEKTAKQWIEGHTEPALVDIQAMARAWSISLPMFFEGPMENLEEQLMLDRMAGYANAMKESKITIAQMDAIMSAIINTPEAKRDHLFAALEHIGKAIGA